MRNIPSPQGGRIRHQHDRHEGSLREDDQPAYETAEGVTDEWRFGRRGRGRGRFQGRAHGHGHGGPDGPDSPDGLGGLGGRRGHPDRGHEHFRRHRRHHHLHEHFHGHRHDHGHGDAHSHGDAHGHGQRFRRGRNPLADLAAGTEGAHEVLQAMQDIRVATRTLLHRGTPEQLAEAQQLLQDTRRALYLILAEQPQSGPVEQSPEPATPPADQAAEPPAAPEID